MLRIVLGLALGFAVVTLVSTTNTTIAQDKKDEPKPIEGTLVCGKCKLMETDACSNVLLVKKDGKDVKYFLVDKGGKEEYHKACCKNDVPAKVAGKIVEKDKKFTIEEPKVELVKK